MENVKLLIGLGKDCYFSNYLSFYYNRGKLDLYYNNCNLILMQDFYDFSSWGEKSDFFHLTDQYLNNLYDELLSKNLLPADRFQNNDLHYFCFEMNNSIYFIFENKNCSSFESMPDLSEWRFKDLFQFSQLKILYFFVRISTQLLFSLILYKSGEFIFGLQKMMWGLQLLILLHENIESLFIPNVS